MGRFLRALAPLLLTAAFATNAGAQITSTIHGVVMQSDVIPYRPLLYSARMEDGYALADASLRSKLPAGLLERADRRRTFMADVLGIELSEDVLPLSNLAGVMPLWMLRPKVAATLVSR